MGLIPASKYWDEVDSNAQDADYTQQAGGPYGLFRTMLFAKAHRLPCSLRRGELSPPSIWRAAQSGGRFRSVHSLRAR